MHYNLSAHNADKVSNFLQLFSEQVKTLLKLLELVALSSRIFRAYF